MALAVWFIHEQVRKRTTAGQANMQVQLRHPESKLTEVDVVNNGNASGPVTVKVDVSWPDADLVDAKGLSNYDQTDTGRRSVQFFPIMGQKANELSPGSTTAIGWVKLTDDVSVHAEIASDSQSTTEP
jgi:hypothetical protein